MEEELDEGDISKVRILESLRINIGEAKNLTSAKDCCCTVRLDQEEVYRTGVKEKTQCPFWAEETTFDVPREFRQLSFFIHEKDWMKRLDSVVGKVALRRDDLHRYHGKDHWFPLQAVDTDSEVYGQVHVEVRTNEGLGGDGTSVSKLTVRVLEGNGLTIIHNQCDPYATVTFRNETKRTKIRRKTVDPRFDESFTFELPKATGAAESKTNSCSEDETGKHDLKIAMWNSTSLGEGVFIGEVRLTLGTINLSSGVHKAWYFLKPRENSKQSRVELGSLRVRINYQQDHVLPSQHYSLLRDILLRSPEIEPTSASAVQILGNLVKDKVEAAKPLIRLFHHHNAVVALIKSLARQEVSETSDPNTIFRGNSLASKCIDEYMRMEGLHYLYDTLRDLLESIYDERKPCEIDPSKLKDGDSLDTNLGNLRQYVEKAYQAIVDSAIGCPIGLCECFYAIKEAAQKRFPEDPDVKYSAVSGFVFLRFFAPAILSPTLFHLRKDNPDEQTSRTLKMVSKAIQTIGNHVNPDKLSNVNWKEEYMSPLYVHILNEAHMDGIKKFLEIISSSSQAQVKAIEAPITLKEGVMIKRAQGRKKFLGFGLKNFKRRWFQLTNHELTYSKTKDSKPLCSISVNNILAVEKLEEESFQMKFMFQVVQPERALYIQANNCVEEKEWLDILFNICKTNKNRLHYYHPAAFKNGHWICCKATSESAQGCTQVTGGLPLSICLDIDPDRELERIHGLFMANLQKLYSLQDACATQAVYQGLPSSTHTPVSIEDPKTCFATVNAMLSEIVFLEQRHNQYKKIRQRLTEYGSKQSPIGDHNCNSFH
ncbi:ras GTPase-activating protein 3-like isoform X1 [Acanthaster planci]|uniref:Ras GTPase-activating protein 3-like isoform X1 n=1 Tax=Acanthaster planci TaxID=133434 RepID=A0A8B7ZB11_ACAPL|nr:ras GTPase-activating protein 3-like isoform X1 [Acanthaster planci]